MRRSLAALGLAILAVGVPATGRCQGQATQLDPLLRAIPPQAVAVMVIDLRAASPSMKTLEAVLPAEQRSATRAIAIRSLAQALTPLGGEVDVENAILSWMTGRAAFAFAGSQNQRDRGMLCLVETTGGVDTNAAIQRLFHGGVAAKLLTPGAPVNQVAVWKATRVGGGTALAFSDPFLLIATSDTLLTQGIRHLEGIKAGAKPTEVAVTLGNLPAGVFQFALGPRALDMARNAGAQRLAISDVAGAIRFEKEGVFYDVFVSPTSDAANWQALSNLRPTHSESIRAIPENALFAVLLSRPGVWLHAMGIPILDGIATGDVGPPAMRAIGNHVAALLSDLLGQEVAFGIVAPAGKPSWVAALTSSRPASIGMAMEALIQSGQAIPGMRATPAPLGNTPGWTLTMTAEGRQPREMHLALVQARLLVAGSRGALEAAHAALSGAAPSVLGAEWFTRDTGTLGPTPLARGAVNTRALGPVLAGMLPQGGPATPKMLASFLETLLGSIGPAAGGARLEGKTFRVVGFAGLDYPKVAAMVNLAIPALASFAAARAAKAVAPPAAGEATPVQTGGHPDAVCQRNLRQLAHAAIQYAHEWGKLPAADSWADTLEPYLTDKTVLRCPALPGQAEGGYAFNRALAELPLAQIEHPAKVILFYESASKQPSPSGTGQDLPNPPRHGGKHAFAFADGHVELAATADPAWWGVAGQ